MEVTMAIRRRRVTRSNVGRGGRNRAPGGSKTGGRGGRGSCGGTRKFDGRGPRRSR